MTSLTRLRPGFPEKHYPEDVLIFFQKWGSGRTLGNVFMKKVFAPPFSVENVIGHGDQTWSHDKNGGPRPSIDDYIDRCGIIQPLRENFDTVNLNTLNLHFRFALKSQTSVKQECSTAFGWSSSTNFATHFHIIVILPNVMSPHSMRCQSQSITYRIIITHRQTLYGPVKIYRVPRPGFGKN